MAYQRDPISTLFDRSARGFLDRAYARPGQWVGTRIVLPGPAEVAWAARQGINVFSKDQWGRNRWDAAFVRACFHQHKWHRSGRGWQTERRLTPNDARGIRYELGIMKRQLGVIPAGRAVRIMSVPGGAAAYRAAAKMPEERKIWEAPGVPGPRFAHPEQRDW